VTRKSDERMCAGREFQLLGEDTQKAHGTRIERSVQTAATCRILHEECLHVDNACTSIYDGFLKARLRYWMVCTSARRCFSVIVISETICISFDFSLCFILH